MFAVFLPIAGFALEIFRVCKLKMKLRARYMDADRGRTADRAENSLSFRSAYYPLYLMRFVAACGFTNMDEHQQVAQR